MSKITFFKPTDNQPPKMPTMTHFICYVKFSPNSMSRAQLKKFEQHCRTQTRAHFAGVKGREYFFRFPTEEGRQSFLHALERQLTDLGFPCQRNEPDLWLPRPKRQWPRGGLFERA